MKTTFTPKQVARALGVSESSLKRWCDKGLLQMSRTAGGHRRIGLESVVNFLRTTRQALVRPELLGLPSDVGAGEIVLDRAVERATHALLVGDDETCRRLAFNLYLAKRSACQICDRVLAPAMRNVGLGWAAGQVDVFEEHRAAEICQRVLAELRLVMPGPPSEGPLAVGGSVAGDPSRIPTTMVELVLREAGWNATSLGPDLPFENMRTAIEKTHPRVFWMSATHPVDEDALVQGFETFRAVAARYNTAVVVGGQAFRPELRERMQYAAFCDNLSHLVSFVSTLMPREAIRT